MIDIGITKFAPGWPKLKAHLEAQIKARREANDSQALSAEQTAGLRGEIAALKALISTVESAPDSDIYNP